MAVAERVIFMSLASKTTKEVFKIHINGIVREYDSQHRALWSYVYSKVDELRKNDIDNYEEDIAKLSKQIRTKQDICKDIFEALRELQGLPPEEDIDEDEEWDDAEPASGKFAVENEE